MSEEKDPPETAEPEESKPERRFSQEHYDRLMKGQEPWLGFRTDWKGEGDPWEAFEKDSPEDAAVIRDTVEAWNMDAPTPALLDGADLRWAHLAGADLKWAHLEGANLRFAHLEEAEFVTAHLERASLVGAHLERANLIGAHLEGAGLYEAHLEGASLVKAHLEEALLPEAHLEGALLAEAHLEGASLNKAILRGADMSRCDLKAANLANADLTDVIGLTAGQLAGADVTSATLPEDIKDFESLKVTDEAAKNSRSLFLNEADLFGADLSGANLFGADLSGADLSGANLFGANVTGVTGGSAAFWRRAAILAARCSDLDTGELTRFEAPTDGAAPEICRR